MSSAEQVLTQVSEFITGAWNDTGASFELINNSAGVPWLLLILWLLIPALRPVRLVIRTYVLTICAVYLLKLIPIFTSGKLSGFDYATVVKAFTEPEVVVVCWAHFIAFDLHAGYTVVEKAHAIGFGLFVRLLLVPTLGLILAAGPAGFLIAHVVIFIFGLFVKSSKGEEDLRGPGLPTSQKKKLH
jgi:hypothetical protein